MTGAAAGADADETYDYSSAQLQHFIGLALRGNCLQPDADHHPYWFPCADYYIATKISADAAELDAQTAAILSDMRRPKKK